MDDNPQEPEVSYWKEQAQLYKSKYEQELDTYHENLATSQEIEKELESQLQIAESERDQYKSRYQQLTIQLENIQLKNSKNNDALNNRLTFLEKENSTLKSNYEDASNQVRKLEQLNDDLERANRATAFSMEEFEIKLNTALEKNALLENELDEKENLLITIQRLKDETKDLQAELNARQKANSHMSQPKWSDQMSFSGEVLKDNSVQTHDYNGFRSPLSSTIPHSKSLHNGITPSSPPRPRPQGRESFSAASAQFTAKQEAVALLDVAPTVRVTALNMISELLRKISHLEAKLSNMYANYGVPSRASIATPDLLVNKSQNNPTNSEVVSTTANETPLAGKL